MTKGILGLMALLLCACNIGATERIFGECNNCTTTQTRDKAVSLAPPFSFNQMVYVYDFTGENITKFLVDKETEPGSSLIYVREAPMESGIQADFELGVIALQEFGISMNGQPINVTEYPNAFSVVNDSNALRQLVELARDTYGWRWEPLWWGSAAVNVANRLTGVYVTLRYYFPDGSTILFKLIDFDPDDLSFTLEFVNGEDADSNSIHQTAPPYAGDTGSFGTASSRDAAVAFFISIGINTSGMNGGGGGPGPFECHVMDDVVHCTTHRN